MLELRKLRYLTIGVNLLFSSVVFAEAIPTVSVSQMLVQPVQDPKYAEAAKQAQRALWMQLGVTQAIDKYQNTVTQEATKRGIAMIDAISPIGHDKLFFVLGTAYSVGVMQEVSGKFNDPFIKSATHEIKVNPQGGTFNITIPL